MTDDFDIIHSYTRAQAIADGVLVDVTEIATEAGFRWPVAVTASVWFDCVAWTEADTERKGTPQDEGGRLWDVLWLAYNAARTSAGGSRVNFQVSRIPVEGRERRALPVALVAVCGPGDEGEPVVTIMQPGED